MDNTHENPVAGIRSWRVDERGLRALHRGVRWRREMRSECVVERHPEPVFGCACGLWARYSLQGWEAYEGSMFRGYSYLPQGQVVGVVSSAGCEIIRGETGFRAGEMRIEAFVEYGCEIKALGTTVSLLPALQALADRIGVPVISPDEIEMFCELEGYELLSPLVGEEPEKEAGTGWSSGGVINSGLISAFAHTSALNKAFADMCDAMLRLSRSTADIRVLPTPQEIIQSKKNRKPMYADLNKRKGLDQPK